MLRGGVNDLGGTLMEETISRMAGCEYGSLQDDRRARGHRRVRRPPRPPAHDGLRHAVSGAAGDRPLRRGPPPAHAVDHARLTDGHSDHASPGHVRGRGDASARRWPYMDQTEPLRARELIEAAEAPRLPPDRHRRRLLRGRRGVAPPAGAGRGRHGPPRGSTEPAGRDRLAEARTALESADLPTRFWVLDELRDDRLCLLIEAPLGRGYADARPVQSGVHRDRTEAAVTRFADRVRSTAESTEASATARPSGPAGRAGNALRSQVQTSAGSASRFRPRERATR